MGSIVEPRAAWIGSKTSAILDSSSTRVRTISEALLASPSGSRSLPREAPLVFRQDRNCQPVAGSRRGPGPNVGTRHPERHSQWYLAQYPTTQFISIGANGYDDTRTSHCHEIGFVTSLPRSGKNRRSIGDQQKFPRALSTVSPAENARLFPLLQQFFRDPHRDGRFARSADRDVPDTDYRTRQPPLRQPSLFIQPRPQTRGKSIRAGEQRCPSIHRAFINARSSSLQEGVAHQN